MIRAGIIGASGYTGQELMRLLSFHPETELTLASSRSLAGTPVSQAYGNLAGNKDLLFTNTSASEAARSCDVLFLALPHGVASQHIDEDILQKSVVIDLGADYRLNDQAVYEQWYRTEHGSPELLKEAVYGLPELHRKRIQEARLIANPGCYTTCSILTLAPLISDRLIDPSTLVIDAKSGVSGAGRTAKTAMMFCECNESVKAYGIATHRHTPEIEQELSGLGEEKITITFTPHLIPMNRGILVTAYAQPREGVSGDTLLASVREFYQGEPFVRVLPEGSFPETRWVKGTNFCDIGITLDQRTGRTVIVGAVDNLIKGASGQAVQNMNIRFSLKETLGLESSGIFPS